MDPQNAIEVRSLKKGFKYTSTDASGKKNIFNRYPKKKIVNVVLNGISFNIGKGEVVGIIGKNGAGKSTLLSVIAKIMEPDSGTVEVNGKIASVLELGMGFHPDLSGRDNIYLKGEMYGFSRKELDGKIERIIEYSGISDYIDNPVRTYSSGMYGRLAFAIMVNVEADIMLIDEILSVGDAMFIEKAKQHFNKMISNGKTVIMVSHSMPDIEAMCSRVLWLDGGTIIRDGPSKEVCSEYTNKVSESPEFLLELAREGVPDSQYKLALLYRDGEYFEKNEKEYERLMELAAASGHTDAEMEYANVLMNRNDVDGAMMLYQSAARKNNFEARVKLASMKCENNESRQRIMKAYGEMANKSIPYVMHRYAELVFVTATDAAEKKESFELFRKSAEGGCPQAMYQMAMMYRTGLGVEKNIQMMEEYLKRASDAGHLPSIMFLADSYYNGKLLQRNEAEAIRLYRKAAVFGNPEAIFAVALAYQDGIGVEKNLEMSSDYFDLYLHSLMMPYQVDALWFVKSGAAPDGTNIENFCSKSSRFANTEILRNVIEYKVSKEKPITEELNLLEILSDSGNTEAAFMLGEYYRNGFGVEKNLKRAMKHYGKGAEFGDWRCREKINEIQPMLNGDSNR